MAISSPTSSSTGGWHLGINLGHDRSAALVRDGEIVVAIHQERLDRIKHSVGMLHQSPADARHVQPPWEAIHYCLDSQGAVQKIRRQIRIVKEKKAAYREILDRMQARRANRFRIRILEYGVGDMEHRIQWLEDLARELESGTEEDLQHESG